MNLLGILLMSFWVPPPLFFSILNLSIVCNLVGDIMSRSWIRPVHWLKDGCVTPQVHFARTFLSFKALYERALSSWEIFFAILELEVSTNNWQLRSHNITQLCTNALWGINARPDILSPPQLTHKFWVYSTWVLFVLLHLMRSIGCKYGNQYWDRVPTSKTTISSWGQFGVEYEIHANSLMLIYMRGFHIQHRIGLMTRLNNVMHDRVCNILVYCL